MHVLNAGKFKTLSLMANKLPDSRKMQKKGGLIFKLDFFKAFDRVSWGFFNRLLEKFGFGYKWRGWLLTCWSMASFSILLNGSSGKVFKSSRGLR